MPIHLWISEVHFIWLKLTENCVNDSGNSAHKGGTGDVSVANCGEDCAREVPEVQTTDLNKLADNNMNVCQHCSGKCPLDWRWNGFLAECFPQMVDRLLHVRSPLLWILASARVHQNFLHPLDEQASLSFIFVAPAYL